jgi:hypothetical protein
MEPLTYAQAEFFILKDLNRVKEKCASTRARKNVKISINESWAKPCSISILTDRTKFRDSYLNIQIELENCGEFVVDRLAVRITNEENKSSIDFEYYMK